MMFVSKEELPSTSTSCIELDVVVLITRPSHAIQAVCHGDDGYN
jgi:hypothetical protein